MIKNFSIRTSKFPYFFWSFNKAYECELDFYKKIYKNLERHTQYDFCLFNFATFLILKYMPIFCVFVFCFNVYDFKLNINSLMSYILAIMLLFGVNFLENLTRKITIYVVLFLSLIIGYLIQDFFIIAYALKYFLLAQVILLVYIDVKTVQVFSILQNGKTISHFLLDKKLLEDSKWKKLHFH